METVRKNETNKVFCEIYKNILLKTQLNFSFISIASPFLCLSTQKYDTILKNMPTQDIGLRVKPRGYYCIYIVNSNTIMLTQLKNHCFNGLKKQEFYIKLISGSKCQYTLFILVLQGNFRKISIIFHMFNVMYTNLCIHNIILCIPY